jgi:uncharacterized protein YbbC (DUF1343 family)
MALHLIAAARCLSGDAWKWNPHFDRLAGGSAVRSAWEAGAKVKDLVAGWDASIFEFTDRREKYLLYG